jgi:hypothetical protein
VTRFRVSASPRRIFDAPRGTPRRRRSTTADARRDARRATTRIRDRGYDERDATARRRIDASIDGDRAID